jgi:hypothetical protein
MWHLLKLSTILLCCIPAFFRSRKQQVRVELALRQQMASQGIPALLAIDLEARTRSTSDFS